ncbi:hypothetical protein [Alicyclobacillus fodiniaquatilis]|jgi:hypothetical protein|uniref:Uncharacterized protein n=1 Tax=Alicyclobacillus fodiniaquatilis TaxID=1661150 RepID=A0ABW4JDQ9_9BACL
MAHPLYPVAKKLVGKHVHAHHVSGRIYQGYLHNVNSRGIYLMQTGHASTQGAEADVRTLNQANEGDLDTVYFPAGYFAFGALTGLTLGALASRPPYYGYGGYYGGYGYGGYGGYGGPYMW